MSERESFYHTLVVSLTQHVLRYTQNGILHMLERNKRIKTRPERFQSCKDQFDLVITCEERVYDQVLEGERDPQSLEGNEATHDPFMQR